jgi:WD40 repeat protein
MGLIKSLSGLAGRLRISALAATALLAWLAALILGNVAGPLDLADPQDPCPVECTTLRGHTSPVSAVAFAPDGRTLASGGGWPGRPGELKLWDVAAGRLRASLDVPAPVWSVAVSPDGQTLATGAADGSVRLWDLATGVEQAMLVQRSQAILCVAFSPDGRRLAVAGQEPPVTLWDLARRCACDSFPSGVCFAGFSRDGSLLATQQRDARWRRWHVAACQADARTTPAGMGLAFSPCGRLAALVEPGHTIALWDWDRSEVRLVLRGHEDLINAVAFSPDGRTLASGSCDRTVRLWDVASEQERAVLTGHTGAVYCVAFSADGLRLATAGFDRTVRLWDLARYRAESGGRP